MNKQNGSSAQTLVDILKERATDAPDLPAFTFLEQNAEVGITFGELDRDARRIARMLLQRIAPGDRVILLYPPSPAYIKAFYACLYAGAIAVPLYPPKPKQRTERIGKVIENCNAKLALSTGRMADSISEFLADAGIANCALATTDTFELAETAAELPSPSANDIAYLQYTSGSTGMPKGVMISHANVLANVRVLEEALQADSSDVFVNWLPLFHDFGLVAALLWPVYQGVHSIMMAPVNFVQRPAMWLEAITRFRGTISCAPNFAYELCVNKIRDDHVANFDLCSWRAALDGAEPVNPDIIDEFSKRFSPAGFRRQSFYPCYGMAEVTLFHTGGNPQSEPVIEHFDRDALQRREVVTASSGHPSAQRLVGCGRSSTLHDLCIVDPETGERLPENRIGEIWLSGPSVAQGYWEMPAASERTFRAQLTGESDGAWLRSGDLGFLRNGEVFISGRIKDVFIVHGRNHYPQDLELLSQRSHSGLRPSSGAAFTVDSNGAEAVVIVQEVEPRALKHADLESMAAAIHAAVLEEFDLPLHEVVLIRPGSIPKTSSGKIQRARTRELLAAGELPVVCRLRVDSNATSSVCVPPRNRAEQQVADIWEQTLARSPISVTANFFAEGGHSLLAAVLVARLRQATGRDVQLATLLRNPTIEKLAARLDELAAADDALPAITHDASARHEPFPLNDVQQAYWLGRQDGFVLGGVGVHGYAETEIDDIDTAALETAWNRLVQRHDMLRMTVTSDGLQRVHANAPPYRIAVNSLPEDSALAERQLNDIRERMSHKFYSGAEWPLFELQVSRRAGKPDILHASLDALNLDLSSLNILGRELSILYANPDAALPAIDIQFRDYVLAERAWQSSSSAKAAGEYWRKRLPKLPGGPELPLAVEPVDIGTPRFERRAWRLAASDWRRLKQGAGERELSPNALIAACFASALQRWSRRPHFMLNLTLFNRQPFHPHIDNVVGDFTALSLLEVDRPANGDTLQSMASRLQSRLWSDLEHRDFNAIRLQQEISAARGETVAYPVVMTSALGLQQESAQAQLIDFHRDLVISQTPQVWLDFQVSEVAGALSCNWDSVDGLFPDGLLDAMFGAFTGLLERLAQDAALWDARDVSLLPASTTALIAAANDTNTAIPDGLLHDPLLERVVAQPDAIAVITRERRLSYRELGLASQQLAAQLKAHGARANRLVAVLMDKGWEQVVAVLGILRAGAAYLPIDASLPPERIRQLLALGEVEQVVTVPGVTARLTLPEALTVHTVDARLLDTAATLTFERGLPCQAPTDLAYVIFTSGSTGTPKGVMIDHRGALNTVIDINTRYGVSERDTVLGLSSLSFDLSVYDIFGVLGAGGRLVLPAPEERRDPEAWLDWLHREQVTLWNTVPALMQMLVEYAESRDATLELALVMMSGDWIPTDLPRRIRERAPQARRISLGGATEASIWSIAYPITQDTDGWRSVPYGAALANQRFYVLKSDLSPAPVWVPGELYIGGIGLALGYWKDEAKTDASFVTHPVSGERLYRTGDLGRWLPDGNIEFLGREDAQVKVQGYRIELGEVEARLKQHPRIHDAVVNTFDAGKSKQLVAYVVTQSTTTSTAVKELPSIADQALREELREFLQVALPDYMVPAHILELDRIPLSANGKVNRNALPAPHIQARRKTEAANDTEAALVDIVARILDTPRPGMDDNFFDIGGSSLHATQLVTRVRSHFQVEFSIRSVFRAATLAELAAVIAAAPAATAHAPPTEVSRRAIDERDETEQELLEL